METFGSRIALTRCLSLVPAHRTRSLEVLRKIRNHAAHHAEDVTFRDQKVIDLVRNLRSEGDLEGLWEKRRTREQFLLVVTNNLTHLWSVAEIKKTLRWAKPAETKPG